MPTIGFPLLLIPLAIYNIFVFLMPDVAFSAPVVTVHLLSGIGWQVTFGDMLLALGLVLLLFEVAKTARPGAKYFTDHLLSLLVLCAAAAEFVWLAPFGTSTFFLLTVLSGVDFLAGSSIALRQRKYRRDFQREQPVHEAAPAPRAEPSRNDVPDQLQRTEPSVNVTAAETHRPSDPPPLQEPPRSVPPASVDVPPPLEQIFPAEHRPPATPSRTISDWNVSDLVSDPDHEAARRIEAARNAAVPPATAPQIKPEK